MFAGIIIQINNLYLVLRQIELTVRIIKELLLINVIYMLGKILINLKTRIITDLIILIAGDLGFM